MLSINAYILAADPTWLERSVGAYYSRVTKIIVSYDRRSRGWTGAWIPVQECLQRLRRLDALGKMVFVEGDFSAEVADPMLNDTRQRNEALALASVDADWVLQLDTDEWIPDMDSLIRVLEQCTDLDCLGVEWPMRVLFRSIGKNKALEVCAHGGRDHYEYIAPIVIRAGTQLVHSRRAEGKFLRATVSGDNQSVQILREPAPSEVRLECLRPQDVILHNSWARPPHMLRRKLSSWSHSCIKVWWYYLTKWLPAKQRWRRMRDFHPFFGGIWPALRVVELPFPIRDTVEASGGGNAEKYE